MDVDNPHTEGNRRGKNIEPPFPSIVHKVIRKRGVNPWGRKENPG